MEPVIRLLAPALTEYLDISISSETSSGMTANLLMVDEGTCELGFTGTDFAYEAWTGTATWTDKTCRNFRSIMQAGCRRFLGAFHCTRQTAHRP